MKFKHVWQSVKWFAAFTALVVSSYTNAAFILSFEGSPDSWVGRGESFTVTPDDDYLFSVNNAIHRDNSLHFQIASKNSPFGPDWDPISGDEYHYWLLDISAPDGEKPGVGLYENTARWPFVNAGQAGLTFLGDHRGDNQDSGFFNILAIDFDPSGILTSIAIDFTQYGENNLDWWLHGSLRFNSDIPVRTSVPEPGAFLLIMIGMVGLLVTRKHYQKAGAI